MEIRPAEISEILKKQIAAFDTEQNVAETGQVLSGGDGIARVQAGGVLPADPVEHAAVGVEREQAHRIQPDDVGGGDGGIGGQAGGRGDSDGDGRIRLPANGRPVTWIHGDRAQRGCVGLHMDAEHIPIP